MKRIRLISKSIIAMCAIVALSFYVGEVKAQTGMTPQWVLHSQKDGVKIYYQVSRCVPSTSNLDPTINPDPSKLIPTKLLLKFENLDAVSKTVTWNSNASSSNVVQMQSKSLQGMGTQIIDCSTASEIQLKSSNANTASTSLAEVLGKLNVTVATTNTTN